MKRFFNRFIIEKPNFQRLSLKWAFSGHCYLLPTGNAFSKSMAEHCYHSHDADGKQIDKYHTYLVTYAYTIFFLWFRLHISFKHDSWQKGQLMQNYNPTDKSKTFIEDILKD